MSGLIAGASVVVAHDDPAPGLKRLDPLGHRLRDHVAIGHHQHAEAVQAALVIVSSKTISGWRWA